MRKVILINKPFQYSILAWFSFLSIILISIFYSTIWYFFYNLKKEAVSVGLPPDHIFFTFINEQKSIMDNVFIVSSIIALLVILIGGLILSHKVAGPLYRLTKHLQAHDKNNTPPLKFRKGDYFPEIEKSFNDFLNK
jgi:sterol desaturase/sphingolipid hydroxylase (fatty acid hydroxylase superfamily)